MRISDWSSDVCSSDLTGFVRIKRWVTSEDCGNMINPAVVEGQIAGGLAQAIGSVLMEEVSFDPRGNPTAVTYKDYMLPTIFDVPDFEYHHEASQPSKAEGDRKSTRLNSSH